METINWFNMASTMECVLNYVNRDRKQARMATVVNKQLNLVYH